MASKRVASLLGIGCALFAISAAIRLGERLRELDTIIKGSNTILTSAEMIGTWTDAKHGSRNAITFENRSEAGHYLGSVENMLGCRQEQLGWSYNSDPKFIDRRGSVRIDVWTGRWGRPIASSLIELKARDHHTLTLTVLKDRPNVRESPALFTLAEPLELTRVASKGN